jgi:hypothetical protein
MKSLHSPVLFGTVGIREVVRYPCVFQLLVKIQKILTPIVRVDGSNGKREVSLKFLDKVAA